MKRTAAILAALVLAGLVIVILGGCAAEDRAAAERAAAEANQTRAQAEAYAQRQQADTAAAAERSAIREAETNAALARLVAVLPYVLAIGGGLFLAGFGGLLWWDLRRRPVGPGQPGAAPALPVVNVFVLSAPENGRRADQWRQLEAAARREVVAIDDRRP